MADDSRWPARQTGRELERARRPRRRAPQIGTAHDSGDLSARNALGQRSSTQSDERELRGGDNAQLTARQRRGGTIWPGLAVLNAARFLIGNDRGQICTGTVRLRPRVLEACGRVRLST